MQQLMADSPRSILARLEQLKQWQEEQQRVLLQKHFAQQQLLEKEQQKMYEVLGLQQHATNDGEQSFEHSDCEPEYEETNLQAQLVSERLKQVPANHERTMDDSDAEHLLDQQQKEAIQMKSNAPKRPFLKRGEGLRARFKVDPDEFKLDNLPKYKFANHNKERNNRRNATKRYSLPGKEGTIPSTSSQQGSRRNMNDAGREDGMRKFAETKSRFKSEARIILDVNRVQDKKLKSTTKHEVLQPSTVNADSMDGRNILTDVEKENPSELTKVSQTSAVMPDAPWKRRLDPLLPPTTSKEERDLNFFELLEQKVIGKSFNPNSSSILRFIDSKDTTANEETLNNADTLCNQADNEPLLRPENLKAMAGLCPVPLEVAIDDDIDSSDDYNERCEKAHAHVRFANERHSEPTLHDELDVADQESYTLNGMALSKMSTPNDKFVQRSQSLENTTAHDSTVGDSEDTDDCTDDGEPTADEQSEEEATVGATDGDDTLRNEILAKSDLLKQRLAELEREIDNYRRENAELIRAKQDHEMERMKLQQDREEMEEHMNDERIKMEVYFHDERMKIESERKQAQREAQKPNRKDREEIVRLKEELAEVKKHQKEREAKHSASLSRFRAQVKNMEKDLQEVRLELEVTKKDNRRLETENARLKRQNNSRMLVEINRNIAKLAAGGVGEAEREQKETKVSPENAKGTYKPGSKIKSHPLQVTERKTQIPPQARAKVTNYAPARSGQSKARGKSLPLYVNESSSESDENEENIPQQKYRHSLEEHPIDDSDDDDDGEVLGENSSSAQETEPSAYFPKNPVRKTLFSAVDVKGDAVPMKLGIVRQENPSKHGNDSLDRTPEAAEIINSLKREIVNADGSRDIWYPNGNLKKISPDGLTIRMLYFNKDIKETNMTEGTTKYYYFETNTWHTTYLDGLEILEFPDGQTEHRFKDGSTEVHFQNGSIRTTNPNSVDIAEEWKYPDGTTVIIRKNDDKEINLPNGQVEIHTKAHKRRIYPDGTVKFVYPDGSQESRYSNGRVRLKDKDGRLISDTGGAVVNGALMRH